MEFYAYIDDKQCGPYTEKDIVAMYKSGSIKKDTMVWHEGLKDWTEFSNTAFYAEKSAKKGKKSNKKSKNPNKKSSFGKVLLKIFIVLLILCGCAAGGFYFLEQKFSKEVKKRITAINSADDVNKFVSELNNTLEYIKSARSYRKDLAVLQLNTVFSDYVNKNSSSPDNLEILQTHASDTEAWQNFDAVKNDDIRFKLISHYLSDLKSGKGLFYNAEKSFAHLKEYKDAEKKKEFLKTLTVAVSSGRNEIIKLKDISVRVFANAANASPAEKYRHLRSFIVQYEKVFGRVNIFATGTAVEKQYYAGLVFYLNKTTEKYKKDTKFILENTVSQNYFLKCPMKICRDGKNYCNLCGGSKVCHICKGSGRQTIVSISGGTRIVACAKKCYECRNKSAKCLYCQGKGFRLDKSSWNTKIKPLHFKFQALLNKNVALFDNIIEKIDTMK